MCYSKENRSRVGYGSNVPGAVNSRGWCCDLLRLPLLLRVGLRVAKSRRLHSSEAVLRFVTSDINVDIASCKY